MLVRDCPVFPDHLLKENCSKNHLRYLNYIVELRVLPQHKFALHISFNNLKIHSRGFISKLTPVILQSQDESDEGSRDAKEIAELPNELIA